MSYKKSFLIEIFSYFLSNFVDFFVIYFLFQKFPSIKGWSVGEIYYLYGISFSAFALAQLFGDGLEKIPDFINTGEFDQFLIRPISPILKIMSHSFRFNRLGRLAYGILTLLFSFSILKIDFNFYKIFFFSISIFSSIIVYFSLLLGGAALCFWTIQSTEAMNAFTHGGVEFSKYPISIYPEWMRKLFFYLIPIGFVSYYPNLAFLEKNDLLQGDLWLAYLSPFVSIVFLFINWILWKIGVNHYQSTGS